MGVVIDGWLKVLFEESPIAIAVTGGGVVLDGNTAYVSLFGYDGIEELRGRSLLELVAPSHRQEVLGFLAQRVRGERSDASYESRAVRKDGTEFPLEVTAKSVVVTGESLTLAFFFDLTKRDEAFQAVRASEERFRTLAGAALEGVFVIEEDRIVLANEAGAAMYGYDPALMVGASMTDTVMPEDRERLLEHLGRATTAPFEGIGRRRDGTRFFVEARSRSLLHQGRPALVSIIRDITERKRIEAEQAALAERVRHAQKLESLAVLAGGIAHDFNNILTVITNAITVAKTSKATSTAAEQLDVASLATERAAELCRQMLAYAGKGSLTRSAVDLSAVVAEMASMLEGSVRTKATLVRELAADLPVVLGDATQIGQVVMNIVINAVESTAAPHGTVFVATGVEALSVDALARSAAGGDPQPGKYVYVEVRDDGVGMDAATRAKMFDPFFTTKFVGRGLGMAAAVGIVRGHGGVIEVESEVGVGTRIRVSFPAATQIAPPVHAARARSELRGHGIVLVVDDEDNVRFTTRLVLQGFGFDVLLAREGSEAVEVFRSRCHEIGVVMLDLTMPKMDGFEVLAELRRIAPSVPVVLTSGYGEVPSAVQPASDLKPDAVLGKPYSSEELFVTLQKLLRPVSHPS